MTAMLTITFPTADGGEGTLHFTMGRVAAEWVRKNIDAPHLVRISGPVDVVGEYWRAVDAA